MPAKRKAREATDGTIASKPKAKVAKGKAYKMPPPLPHGEVVTSLDKSQWKIGRSIGKGGFGEIYSAGGVTVRCAFLDQILYLFVHTDFTCRLPCHNMVCGNGGRT